MNKSKVFELAREAGFLVDNDAFNGCIGLFQQFAALIEAEVRGDAEPVAKVMVQKTGGNPGISWFAVSANGDPLPILDDGTLLYTHPTPAVVAQLVEALEEARHDVNWMLNNKQFLNPFVFDYIDAALAAVRGQE